MTQDAKASPIREADAPIKCIGRESRPHADKIALSTGPQGTCAGNRKTLNL